MLISVAIKPSIVVLSYTTTPLECVDKAFRPLSLYERLKGSSESVSLVNYQLFPLTFISFHLNYM